MLLLFQVCQKENLRSGHLSPLKGASSYIHPSSPDLSAVCTLDPRCQRHKPDASFAHNVLIMDYKVLKYGLYNISNNLFSEFALLLLKCD